MNAVPGATERPGSGPRTFGAGALALLGGLTFYLPLEEFLLKWLPGGDSAYFLARMVAELLIYGALAAVVLAYHVRGLALPRSPLDLPLALFLGLALLSLACSDGPWLGGLLNLRVLVRYVALSYLVLYLGLSRAEARGLLRFLLAGALLQVLLGLVQFLAGGVGGMGAGSFWLPRAAEVELGGIEKEFATLSGGIEAGAVLGTLDHPVAFALFLLVAGTLACALALTGQRRSLFWLVPLCGAGIVCSYSRASLLGYLLALACVAWCLRREAAARRLAAPAVLLAPLALGGAVVLGPGLEAGFVPEKETRVDPLASLELVFTREYLQRSQGARLWILRDVGGAILRSAGWLGFGPDEEHAKQRILAAGGAGLQRLIAYRAFEDVHWVALLAYYGFLGLAAFVFLLLRLLGAALRARAEASEPVERALAAVLVALLVLVFPLSFLAPTLDFRAFAFPFWLLSGLVLGAAGRRTVPRRARAPAPVAWSTP